MSAVYQPEELMPAAHALARKIADGPPVAIRLAKRGIDHRQRHHRDRREGDVGVAGEGLLEENLQLEAGEGG